MSLEKRLIKEEVFKRVNFELIANSNETLEPKRHLYKNKDYIVEASYVPIHKSLYVHKSWSISKYEENKK